jgi:hypothetical protein
MSNPSNSLRLPHAFRPYYYGPHKWEDYLIDIQEAILAGAYPQQQPLQETLIAGIEELRAEFQWGFTLLVDRLEQQIKALNQIVGQLDAIRQAVQLPSTTRARELFTLGQRDQQKGLLPEPLEKFLAAERENKVNFPLQLQIGKLLLYGKDQNSDVIDLPKAEQHLLLAARYAAVEKGYLKYHGESLFHAAIAAYLIGQQEKATGHSDAMQKCLERALIALSSAARSWPEFSEIVYVQAKSHALLGQKQEAIASLRNLSDRDRRYFAKMSQDRDFDAIRSEAEDVFRRAIEEPGPLTLAAQAKLRDAEEALAEAENTEPKSEEDRTSIASTSANLTQIRESLKGLDADIEGIPPRLVVAKSNMEQVVRFDIVDCDADPTVYFISGAIMEHRRSGQVKLKLCDGELYANGVRIVRYQSPEQQRAGSIRGSKLYKTLKDKPVLNACMVFYLCNHPQLIPHAWSGSIHFWGTVYRDPKGIPCVPGLVKYAERWCHFCEPLDRVFGTDDFAAVLAR